MINHKKKKQNKSIGVRTTLSPQVISSKQTLTKKGSEKTGF